MDCAEINTPLEDIRKLVAVDEGSKSVERKSGDADAKDVFWKLVGEAAADWKQRDVSKLSLLSGLTDLPPLSLFAVHLICI